MRKVYEEYVSIIMFLIGVICGVVASAVTIIFYINDPSIINLYIAIPICSFFWVLMGTGFIWKDHPPIQTTKAILKFFGYYRYLERKLEKILIKHNWKYRVGQELKTHMWDGDTLVRVVGYYRPEERGMNPNKYYTVKVLQHSRHPHVIGYRDEVNEDRLELPYKFDLNDHKQLFGFIHSELRRNGILKEQT